MMNEQTKKLRGKITALLCPFGEDCNPKYCRGCGHFKKGKCEDPAISQILKACKEAGLEFRHCYQGTSGDIYCEAEEIDIE